MGEAEGYEYDFSRLSDLASCPPSDAIPQKGTFFAFHESDPPSPADFQTADQRAKYIGKDPCQRRSNSVFGDLQYARRRVDELKRKHVLVFGFISAGEVTAAHGKMQQTGKGSHYSFWVCGKTSMHKIFTIRVP